MRTALSVGYFDRRPADGFKVGCQEKGVIMQDEYLQTLERDKMRDTEREAERDTHEFERQQKKRYSRCIF